MIGITLTGCAGYVRCSTNTQGGPEGSLDQQKKEILNWANKNKLRVDHWYEDEGKSGTTFENRPGFLKLISDIEKGPTFKYLLCYDESRWGRSPDLPESSYWKYHFSRFGVIVIIINSNSNGNDIGAFIVRAVETAEASEFSKKLSRSTLRGQKTNAENGFSCGGSAPFGYKRIALNKVTNEYVRDLPPSSRAYPDEKVIYAINPQEAEIVKRIFKYKIQGLGYKKICDILNSEGIPSPKRGRWKNKDQKWAMATLLTICTNPTYTGARIFNRHPQSHISGPAKAQWFNPPEEWVVKKNAHPRIISEEIFNEINRSRKPYSRKNRFFFQSPYLLSGKLTCSKCGFHFQGQTRRLRSEKTGEEYKINYYQDSGYQNKGNSVCKSFLLRKEELEGFVIKQIKNFISDKNFLEKVYKTIEKKLFNASEIDSLLSSYNKQLENNKKVLQNLLELIRTGVTLEEVQTEILRINLENEHLQKNCQELKNKKIEKTDIKKLIEKIKVLVDNFEFTFKNAPLHLQKNLINQFVDSIIVNPVKLEIHCNFRKVPWILDSELSQKDIYGIEGAKYSLNGKIKASRKSA